MNASTDWRALAILPHRAYRRPARQSPAGLGITILIIVAAEALIVTFLGDLARAFSHIASALLPGGETLSASRFFGIRLEPLDITIKQLDYRALLAWVLGGAAGLAVLWAWRSLAAPARFMIGYNIVLTSASAAYLLFAGQLGYDALDFSELYLRTAIVVWLILPVLIGGLALSLPFSLRERALIIATCLLYNFVFSAVRYAAFGWALATAGGVVMANLYLFLGPLLDFVYVVGVISVFLPPLSRRMDREGPQELWTWL